MKISVVASCFIFIMTSSPLLADGDSFSKALGNILGGKDNPKKRDRNSQLNNSITTAIFGGRLERNMTDEDRRMVAQSIARLDRGRKHVWHNDNTQTWFTLSVESEYMDGGKLCKRFAISGNIKGHTENKSSYGCRERPGLWTLYGLGTPTWRDANKDDNEGRSSEGLAN